MMSHVAFVSAAYGVTVLVLAGIALWLAGDHRARKRELADLEARGVRRRSAR
jgi:heme exporter protein D